MEIYTDCKFSLYTENKTNSLKAAIFLNNSFFFFFVFFCPYVSQFLLTRPRNKIADPECKYIRHCKIAPLKR